MINDSIKSCFKSFKQIVVYYFLLFLVFIALVVSLNLSGFCFSQMGYLSDKEKIDIAVNRILQTYPPVIEFKERKNINGVSKDLLVRKIPEYPVFYDGLDDFYKQNEGCCEITQRGRDYGDFSFLSKVVGSGLCFVRVKFKVKYMEDNNKIISKDHEAYYALTNCGRPWTGI